MSDGFLEQTLIDLEWPTLLEQIASHAASELGREKIAALRPLSSQEEVEVRLSILSEVLGLHERAAFLPRRDVLDVRDSVERARRHGVIGSEELLGLVVTLGAARDLHQFSSQHRAAAPLLSEAMRVDEEAFELLRRLREAVDESGEIRDSASKELAEARRELTRMRAKVSSRLNELLIRYKDVLQDGYVAERSGRYVLPVRSDAPYKVDGTVFGSSASGSTLYLEPQELAPLSNQLRLAESEVARQEAKIRAELSRLVGADADSVLWAQEVAVRGDLLRTISEWSKKTDSRILQFGAPGSLFLEEARHPILAHGAAPVVPYTITLGAGTGLVISGPNAGGKTVLLKALGLSALLMATGLPIPAKDTSSVGFFECVMADIGDDQSLSMNLSTFSGHVERVARMFTESEAGALILIDELMSGTDPNEGAVLAVSVLDEFVRQGKTVVLTTHYEALKVHAEGHEKLENAAAGFDFRQMRPTFVIEQGRPGASSALAVAERFGLPARVTKRALELLPEEERRRRETLTQIEQLKSDLLEKTRELTHTIEEQRVTESRLSAELEKAREARRNELLRESDELRRELMLARAELKQKRKELKGSDEVGVLREIERSVDQAAKTIAFGGEVERAARKPVPELKARSYRVGEKIRVAGLQTPATVLEILPKGQLRVMAGVMKLVVTASEVTPVGGPPPKPAPAKAMNLAKHSDPPVPLKVTETCLDLRGVRVEEGLLRVDSFLDELLRRQEAGGYVLHGHGTGAMRDAVREHLRGHAVIESSRPAEREEGGDAWTVFWLRGMN